MGAELGATTSIFPSDEITEEFLRAQCREEDFTPLSSDPDAVYDKEISVDLSKLEPLAAMPHMPDKVKKGHRDRTYKGRSGADRKLHQLIALRYAESSRDT